MKMTIEADIKEATKALSDVGKSLVPLAALRALKDGVRHSHTLAVRYAAKDFKITNTKVRQRYIVTVKKPWKLQMWGAVWFNPYTDSMSEIKGYTLADTKKANAGPRPGKNVIGEPFAVKFKRRGSRMFVGRDSGRGRTKPKTKKGRTYTSSQVNVFYYKRMVRNAYKKAAEFQEKGEQRFYEVFNREMDRRLANAGLL